MELSGYQLPDRYGGCDTAGKITMMSINIPATDRNFMLNTNNSLGITKMKGGVKILLYIDRALSAEEKDTLERTV